MAFIKGSDGIARSLKENKDVTYRYADSDVATYLPTNTANVGAGNVNSNNLIASGQVVAATGDFTTVEGDTITDGTLSINAGAISGATSGAFSTTLTATGNITGANFNTVGKVQADFIQLANSVSAGTTIAATGNISGGNISAAGTVASLTLTSTGNTSATGNVSGGNILTLGAVIGTTVTATNSVKMTVYADNTARDAAITSPTAGQMVFKTDIAKLQFYNGSAWETVTSAV